MRTYMRAALCVTHQAIFIFVAISSWSTYRLLRSYRFHTSHSSPFELLYHYYVESSLASQLII